jgi:hypothetical protein
VNPANQSVSLIGDDRESVKLATSIAVKPRVPEPGKREWLALLEVNPLNRSGFSIASPAPLIKPASRNKVSPRRHEILEHLACPRF